MERNVLRNIRESARAARGHLAWLRANMDPAFLRSLREEPESLGALCLRMGQLSGDRQLVLADREKLLLTARLSVPGSLFETLSALDRDISFCQVVHSRGPIPGTDRDLEIQRFEFDRRKESEILSARNERVPSRVSRTVAGILKGARPAVPREERERLLGILWRNNPGFVRLSPPDRVARILRLLHQAMGGAGVRIDVQEAEAGRDGAPGESRVLIAVENPPQRDYLRQLMEVFNRLDLGVRSALTMIVSTGSFPYFLGTFRVARRDGGALEEGSPCFCRLIGELYNVQLLSNGSETYRRFVLGRIMTGGEATLVEALIGFCHTSLVHNQPHRFTLEDVARAFHSHPDIALMLARVFELRFDPETRDRGPAGESALSAAEKEISEYNTGHRQLDEFRREVFRAALLFVRRTLKTNFFVQEKQALAFRLDPAYLDDLGPGFTSDLPPRRPFRVTYFFGRNGLAYHVGFSDIARGGWRTVLTRSRDDYVTVANAVFRECYVLAHTQHLKNKDIFEGGSKMVAVVRARSQDTGELADQRLHKVQYAFANAFFDIFVTSGGRARDPRVVDYYGEDEPIELGPDENMHDRMIEAIARLSTARGYMLGVGVMSSKKAGINHRQYGVTSTGVVKFAEIAMRETGTDIRSDVFFVKFTGGPNGDVAGNAMRILLERCPKVAVRLVLD
ncbi:MAG: NAD-glutamate dehydrogenase, partial [Deltaproteobacteria bacterium]|nr:NAD-glutamate dehydrogenase [Deltaproteobacteria bacterium]